MRKLSLICLMALGLVGTLPALNCTVTVTGVHAQGDGLRLLPANGGWVAEASTEEEFTATILAETRYVLSGTGNTIPEGVSYDHRSGFLVIPAAVLAANVSAGIQLTVTAEPISYRIVYNALGDGAPTLASPDALTPEGTDERCWVQTVTASNATLQVAAAGTLNAEGWTFLGWSKMLGAATADFAPGETVAHLTAMDEATIRLYAVWKTTTHEGVVSYPVALQNGSFEVPVLTKYYEHIQGARITASAIVDPNNIGWSTTESGNRIEVGRPELNLSSAYGVTAVRDGMQMAELNAGSAGSLYQRIAVLPHTPLHWGFSHRCRGLEKNRDTSPPETMAMWVGSPEQIEAALAIYNKFAVETDPTEKISMSNAMEQVAALATQLQFTNIVHTAAYNPDTTAWEDVNGLYVVPEGISVVEYAFVSWLAGANGEALSSGNLLDRVYLASAEPPECHILKVTAGEGGHVWINDSSPEITSCAPGDAYQKSLEEGTRLSIVTASLPGYVFAGVTTNGVYCPRQNLESLFSGLDEVGIQEALSLDFVFVKDATITFRPNGGSYTSTSGEPVSEVQLGTSRPSYTLLPPMRGGYDFLGWREKGGVVLPAGACIRFEMETADGAVLIASTNGVDILSVPSGSGMTLYAQWEMNDDVAARRMTHLVLMTALNVLGDGSTMKQQGETAWQGYAFADEDFYTTVFAADGFRLPDSIRVTNEAGEEVTGFTYNSLTGVITIPVELLPQKLNIHVAAERIRYTIVYTSGGVGQIAGTGVASVEGSSGVWQQAVVADGATVTLATQGTLQAEGWEFLGWSRVAETNAAELAAGTAVAHLTRLDLTTVKLYGVWKASDGSVASSYPVMLQNGSFETPSNVAPPSGYSKKYYNQYSQGVPGLHWYTTASDSKIEIASVSTNITDLSTSSGIVKNYHTTQARDGVQFAELNANKIGALYQDVATVPGVTLYYGFSHKAREAGDALALLIGSTNDFARALAIYTEEVNGKKAGWQVSVTNRIAQLTNSSLALIYHEATYDESNLVGWEDLLGSYTVPAGQSVTKFAFLSLSTNSDVTKGNLIDDVYFTTSEPIQTASLTVRTTAGGSAIVNDGSSANETVTSSNTYFNVLAQNRRVVVSPIADEGWTFVGCYVGNVFYSRDHSDAALAFTTSTTDRKMTLIFAQDRTITFDAAGGAYAYNSYKLSAANPTYTLTDPVRTGFVFKGWKELTSGNVYANTHVVTYVVDPQVDETVTSWLTLTDGRKTVKVQSTEGLVLCAQWELAQEYASMLTVTFVDFNYLKPEPRPYTNLYQNAKVKLNGGVWLATDKVLTNILNNATTLRPAGHLPTGWTYEPTSGGELFDFDYIYSVQYLSEDDRTYVQVKGITNGVYQAFRFDDVTSMRFVARWDRFYDVTALEDDGVTTNRVAWVPKSWLDAKGYATTESTYKTVLAENGANGMPLWQSYIFGLDPRVATSVGLNRPQQHATTGKVTVSLEGVSVVKYLNDIYEAKVGNNTYSAWNGSDYRTYSVKFVLQGTDDRTNGPWTPLTEPQDSPVFSLDLKDLVNRYYRVEGQVRAKE